MANSTITAELAISPIWLDAAHPDLRWQAAEPIRFSADWQGKNPDSELGTEVRILWSPEMLYLRFVCLYRDLFVFEDSEPNGRRDHLWDRDVAEAFLQPSDDRRGMGVHSGEQGSPVNAPALASVADRHYMYKEFEVAPNGMWIDLDIFPGGLADLKSGMARSVYVDVAHKLWSAELAIPMVSLTPHFDPAQPWRANFYRVEGKVEPRRYMAWQPTNTPEPQFHVPERFGKLQFER